MIRNLVLAVVFVTLGSCDTQAREQKFIVCPTNKDYCYYQTKPILDQPRYEDVEADIMAQNRAGLAEIRRQHGIDDGSGLTRALRRSFYCNSLGC
jgi:hypothetical protein